jgi:hypothetical protein
MGYGNYQNGGVWDWWGGVQIKAEFKNGFSEIGRSHLLQVAHDWQKHPGNIIEWQSSTDQRHEGSHYYSAAAGTMGSAIIEGFFGVELTGQGLTLQPRLGLNDGYIRVYQAATDRYAAYTYDWDHNATRLNYGTNAKSPVMIKVLKLRSEQIREITIDGQSVEYQTEIVGNDTYTVIVAPGGQHRVEILKGQPPLALAAADTPSQIEPALNNSQTAPSPVQNSVSPRQPADVQALNEIEPASSVEPDVVIIARNSKIPWLTIIQVGSAVLVLFTCIAIVGLIIMHRLDRLRGSAPSPHPQPPYPTVDPTSTGSLPKPPTYRHQ